MSMGPNLTEGSSMRAGRPRTRDIDTQDIDTARDGMMDALAALSCCDVSVPSGVAPEDALQASLASVTLHLDRCAGRLPDAAGLGKIYHAKLHSAIFIMIN